MNSLFKHVTQYYQLSSTAIESMGKVLEKLELPKSAYLALEGKVCNHVYFLEQGCLRGYYGLDGKEISHWFAFENNFVTSFYSFISRRPSIENIQLIEDCKLWAITYDNLQWLYSQHPDIERLGRIMIERYYVMLEERFVTNHFKEARERYENLIEHSPHILKRIPLGYIASYLGISQETLSRIRSKS